MFVFGSFTNDEKTNISSANRDAFIRQRSYPPIFVVGF